MAGSGKFVDPMPYYEVPANVLENSRSLATWAKEAIAVAHVTAKPKKKKTAKK